MQEIAFKKSALLTLFTRSEEREIKRLIDDRVQRTPSEVSINKATLPSIHRGDYSPHYATLVSPLFACGGKRAGKQFSSLTVK